MHLLSLITVVTPSAYYWPQLLFVWLLWALLFGVVGLGIGWLLWRERKQQERDVEEANRRLAEEHRELRRELGNPLWNQSG